MKFILESCKNNILIIYLFWPQTIFVMARILVPKMWRDGAKIEWRSAAVELMRWRENFSRKNGAVVRCRKD